MDVSIILPSYKPDEKLIATVRGMQEIGFDDIIVVDDGGGEEYNKYFDRIRKLDGCTVLVHPENRGKGAAMKTAFKWYRENRNGRGVVTVDGDGQHSPEDTLKCAEELCKTDNFVLGVRDFSLENIPKKSRFGNNTTSRVFKLFLKMDISDTQTGLRAIPARLLEAFEKVRGDRYEYETNQLMQLKWLNESFTEVTISTIYIDENESSHFRPVRDSMRIYWLIIKNIITHGQFFKFMGSSVLCYGLDWLIFTGLHLAILSAGIFPENSGPDTWIPTISARILSSMLNFFLNRNIFNKGGKIGTTIIKYYVLAACILAVSTFSIQYISLGLSQIAWITENISSKWIQPIIKLPIDFILYLISYNVQRTLVFKTKDKQA